MKKEKQIMEAIEKLANPLSHQKHGGGYMYKLCSPKREKSQDDFLYFLGEQQQGNKKQ